MTQPGALGTPQRLPAVANLRGAKPPRLSFQLSGDLLNSRPHVRCPLGSRLPDLTWMCFSSLPSVLLGQTTETPHTEGRVEAVSLYKGDQHYGSTSMLLWLTLARLTASGAEVWVGGGGVTAREEHCTGLGTGEHTSWEPPQGTCRHTNTA